MDRRVSPLVLALAARVKAAAVAGIVEVVPTFRSLMIHYDPLTVPQSDLKRRLAPLLSGLDAARSRAVSGTCRPATTTASPPISPVAARTGLSPEQVVERHSGVTYHVYMVGFLPGYPYLGDLPPELELPRRDTPRTAVPAGSVAVATTLTAVYALQSPRRMAYSSVARPRPCGICSAIRPPSSPPATRCASGRSPWRLRGPGQAKRQRRAAAATGAAPCGSGRGSMKPALRVLAPGMMTTLQDLGRRGYQSLGIPVSGALDAVALAAANALVGNPSRTGALEIVYHGPTVAVEAESARFAFAGGATAIEALRGERASGATRLPPLQSVRLRQGEVLRVGSLSGSAVGYLAVEGGFDVAPVLGSQSTYARAGLGGFAGRPLRAGDLLPLRQAHAKDRAESMFPALDLAPPQRIRVVLGPQDDHFTARGRRTFLESIYTVSPASDRMGMRLEGAALEHSDGFNIASDGTAPGSVQVPGDGLPIVLLADRQTTGGYPKIATVIAADLPALGRLARRQIGFHGRQRDRGRGRASPVRRPYRGTAPAGRFRALTARPGRDGAAARQPRQRRRQRPRSARGVARGAA